MSTEEHDLTIQVETSQSWYDGDAYAKAALTFSSDGKSINLEYNADGSIDKIMPVMLKDIESCIDAPDEWIAEAIRKGPDTLKKLREYEQELAEKERQIKSYQQWIERYQKDRDDYQAKIAELKEKMKQ